ncbi:MAG: IS21 family transposase [Coriobacteriaceae bacterium]|jgi:transposase|uniref:IS21 family transposase n=2 Tax=Bacillota TaxID=1239 RepID=A0A6L5GUD2_9FIRM|nr:MULTISPECIES: IS21 family transposase [Lactobacillaceae]MQM73869.1 IS21 family transposase [Candidatus Pseudoramibacter fermentans]RRF90517.1 MAG: IS21 family transposase [Coriobacteriaceae bacterium]MEA1035424.1 IS21 family transposase [Lactiplantibacillus plantarum]MEA1056806.1 IS21 family transposase [Lacticaseibacillus paracasei]POE38989.1 integrase [Lacticaseibacillus paracasei]
MAIQFRKILELAPDHSQRSIAASTGHSRRKIKEVIERAKQIELTLPIDPALTDAQLGRILFPELLPETTGREIPNFEYMHEELGKKNVTLSLLYYEYQTSCRDSGKIPYSYRSYCRMYTTFAQKYKATMRIRRKPGELMEVDWAGSTLTVIDADTGEKLTAYLYLAVLPSSQYGYCEAFLSMTMPDWIRGHVHAYEYFGGVTEILVSDNLKTGVSSHTKFDPVLNPVYRDMAEHYGTVVMPARVRRPKDKPKVEGTVKALSTWVIAALRNQRFFTLDELNQAVWSKLRDFNQRPFTKTYKACRNREEGFNTEEKFALHQLPATPFEMAAWKIATVQPDYHILVDRMFYSVPFQYIGSQVDVRLTSTLIEVFFKDSRIASHARLYGRREQFSTNQEHMPEAHKLYVSHTPESSRNWALSVGEHVNTVVDYLLNHMPERQALHKILSLQKLGKKYGASQLEEACAEVEKVAQVPTVRIIERVLINRKKTSSTTQIEKQSTEDYGFTRGAEYFGRITNDQSRND